MNNTTRTSARFLDELRADLSYGARQLGRAPTFAVLALLTLGIGIGLNAVLFSIVNGALFVDLPVRNPQELRRLEWNYRVRPDFRNDGNKDLPYPTFIYLRSHTTSFSELFCMTAGPEVSAPRVNVAAQGGIQSATAQFVSGSYFATLGVGTAIGRGLSTEDEARGDAAVLTYGAWQRLFNGDPNVVGRSVAVNQTSMTIVGVTAREFYFNTNNDRQGRDLILPVSQYAAVTGNTEGLSYATTPCHVVGRLKPGVFDEEARAESEILLRQEFQSNPYKGNPAAFYQRLDQRGRDIASQPPQVGLRKMARLVDALTWGELKRDALPVVAAGSFLPWAILFIPCANIASLLLARAVARQREVATRLAMGASRRRLVRQLLTESVLLGCLSALLGIVVSRFLGQILGAYNIPFLLDMRVLAITTGIAVVTGIAFGLWPALRASRADLLSMTKTGTGGSIGRSRLRVGKTLIGVQITLASLILVGVGLVVGSLVDMAASSASDPAQVLVAPLYPSNGLDPSSMANYYRELTRRIEGVPGVLTTSLSADDRPVDNGRLHVVSVAPAFFETMKIPLLRGRTLSWGDAQGAPPVAVVNEAYVRTFHAGPDPLGRELNGIPGQIVGVVADSNNAIGDGLLLGQGVAPTVYVPFQQQRAGSLLLIMRVTGTTSPLVPTIRRVAAELDRGIIVGQVQTQAQLLERAMQPRRAGVIVFLSFGLVALFQAALGIYGTLSYFVNLRIPEIGLRVALGADSGKVTALVLRQSLLPVAIGVVFAFAATPVVRLVMQSVGDAAIVGTGSVLAVVGALTFLMAVAGAAALIPAWRASRIDPVGALRAE